MKTKYFKNIIFYAVFAVFFLISLPVASAALASDDVNCKKIISNIANGAVIVKSIKHSRQICNFNPNTNFKPASLVKILSAFILLKNLGDQYRFKTNFWIDSDNNLILEGLGDPFIISEEINKIASKLKTKNHNFKQLIIEYGQFDDIKIPGVTNTTDPYNALNAALMVNFNTVYLKMDKYGQTITSAEAQTPLTKTAYLYGKKNLQPNQTERLSLGDDLNATLANAGELFLEIFSQHGIRISQPNPVIVKKINHKKTLIYTHQNSVTLKEALQKNLKYSNNVQINQMMLILAAEKLGYPANYTKMLTLLKQQIKDLFPDSYKKINIVEASGISHANKLPGEFLIELLDVFKNQIEILPQIKGVYVKSGTLNEVYNYAGYLKTENDIRSFIILLNQPQNNRDKILSMISKLP